MTSTEDEPIERDDPEERQEREDAVAHMATLADPNRSLMIGSHCYFAGVPPRGRHALDELVRMGRVDLLRKLLLAPSAEGRTYAAIGLRRAGVMGKEELRAFLSSLTGNVQVCSGCMVESVPARDALPYYIGYENTEL